MRRVLIFGILAAILAGCNDYSATENQQMGSNDKSADSVPKGSRAIPDTSGFSSIRFASDRDTTCGMPLSAGITDTMSHHGKIYGFCSPGCRQEFAALVTSVSQSGQEYHSNH